MSDVVTLVVYAAATLGLAGWGGRCVRAGCRNLKRAVQLRDQPLLAGIENSELETLDSEPWPTRGRWPGPSNHPAEFFDAKRRAVYRSVALDKSLGLSLGGEVLLLLSAAYLGYAFPRAVGGLWSRPATAANETREGAIVSLDAISHTLSTLGPTMATLLVVGVAIFMRGRAKYLRRLAAMYKDPGPIEAKPELWVPPRNRRLSPRPRGAG